MSGGFGKFLRTVLGLRSDAEVLAELAAEHGVNLDASPPSAAAAKDFYMPVEALFRVPGRGIVAQGTIQSGRIRKGERVTLETENGEGISVVASGVEKDRRVMEQGSAGEKVGVILSLHLEEDEDLPKVRLLRA